MTSVSHTPHVDTGLAAGRSQANSRRWVVTANMVLGHAVAVPAALLVLAEIVVLSAGIVGRYVFRSPIVWSDEFAGILFLWLAMLGSVIAFQRGEHMRMTAIVGVLSAELRAFLDVIAAAASLAFLVLVVWPAYEFAADEAFVTTPALEIVNTWRAAALPIGIGLMLIAAVLRLIRIASLRSLLASLAIVAGIIGTFILLAPVLKALGNLNLLIFFVFVVGAMVFAAVPIAFAFGLATVGYLALTTSTPDVVMIGRMDEGMSHLILLAVPLFVFLGLLIEMTGMARAMVSFLASLLGHVRGGLHYVLVGAMYLVSGISGSKAADMAAVAPVLFPEMRQRGAKPGDLVALLAATGAQTETIPPSLVLITIGSVTGVSISALFTGGLLPGVVLAIMLAAVVWWRYRREDLSHVKRATGRQIGRAFVIAIPAIALPFVIRTAVVEGVATATEVSTIGILYSACAGLFIYRQFDWRRIYPMLVETASLSGAILLIIGAATGMAWALTQSGFSASLAKFMTSLPGGVPVFLAVTIVTFVILGSVLEGIPAIVLFGPLLFPIARQVGVHDVHYAMVVVLAMGIGLFAPPFGVGYYAACAISRINPDEGMKPIVGYMIALLIGTLIVAAVPWLSIGFL
ncbi:tripartite ATP-independent transporter DctM subunit [Bradyrhizobium huanghuaihaiense]|jgi:tripartite ATP-independent transporter DctM subunit|uniref:Tripartite ATP-independent transporter DctM subunit n=2 Tax=Bradyrhizobium TaxID=374 RepID=A0A562QQ54_9BRAD|nr:MULTISPECIES: TRAP transporter large permease subunit [Bradyrhizobium]APO50780.1 ABC transporter permease [Bradyrhizobium diazoefficiens]KGJ67398.1 putative ABC transporter permease protein [Bradyrhizobium diazoefficiens SEMIA 5080]KOY04656.1 ABC transporter permease [Bradyrhizobium diazoefficiens]MBP1090241.1 tripartite ATP-independent transporter DctM subunit [Bradyrhizobium japonicum]MCD9815888.1 TRAP transporter large permease subunit [Bradyrhizobium diazoefficiens]